jgi:galactokinase
MPLTTFIETFGAGAAFLSRGPGRVNLIGEHTDYNGGYVLPAAISAEVQLVFRPSDDQTVDLVSLDFNHRDSFDLDHLVETDRKDWLKYPMAVAWALQEEGYALRGIKGAMKGSVPIGSGLSSSAAVEVAVCMALCHAAELKVPREKLARICHKAEVEYVGLKVGIMDQFASLLGRKGHVLFLDCTTSDNDLVPLDESKARIVVCDSRIRRELTESPYNERRRECAAAFKLLQRHLPDIKTYKDLSIPEFKNYADGLPETLRKRARHVVTENGRVLHGVRALKTGNLIMFGALMDASHDSLRDDYEASCPELDILVELARDVHGTYGSRLTGAGWGGCTVSLVRPDAVEEFTRRVSEGYKAQTGRSAGIFVFSPAEGATVERILP